MNFLKLSLMLAIVMALAAITLSTNTSETSHPPPADHQMPTSYRGTGRFLAQKPRHALTCDRHPEICSTRGSQGPFCCNKKCVDIKTDKFNCGRCGKKCNYSKICCEGKCVSPLSNQKHCGGCYNNCGKGNPCVYGMCSYA
ncbi:hypothetical protein like AT1G11925 [Hibiscus trionum]|uniref:Stigma-specific Stig1 family protein n=1 Tax=Hibiscus trionum TaxID=183268 RepID=A0A9W7I9T9_HIBTR|nr:hypothetical protein like AT1G11925 [Hibiscus trionum]